MNKRMRELQALMEEKTTQAESFMSGENKDVAKAKALLAERKELMEEFELEKELFEAKKAQGMETATPVEIKGQNVEGKAVNDPVAEFGKAAKAGFMTSKTFSIGSDPDGGYAVTPDIQTRINTLKEAGKSLKSHVRVEKVKNAKGTRVFKERKSRKGFAKVNEFGQIPAGATPKLSVLEYEISKYGGIFAVSNEALADADASLGQTLIEDIAEESRVTENNEILALIATLDEVDLKNMDGIKHAVNVTLGQAFKATSKIITNDDGLQYLDTLKDENGRYLLAPMPGDTLGQTFAVGGTRLPVEVMPNSDMPTSEDGKIPFIIGDLYEGIAFFDRELMTILASAVASAGELNAFDSDLTLYRALARLDVKLRDRGAIVNGYIIPSEADAATVADEGDAA